MTCCAGARRLALALAVATAAITAAITAAGCGSGTVRTTGSAAEAINPFLGPDFSQWMVGPIARMATPEEREAFSALRDDAAAEEFITAFWERRDPAPARPDNPLRETFEERAAEADDRYTESTYSGRRTDRGTIYILFGEPERTDYEISSHPDDPPIEVWFYGDDAEPGLSGEDPASSYRFIKRGDVTAFYTHRRLDDPRDRRQRRPDRF